MKTWSDVGIDLPESATGEVYAGCPRCSAQRKKKGTKPLAVNVEKEVWHCYHCGWTGGLAQGEKHGSRPYSKKTDEYIRPAARGVGRQPGALPPAAIEWFRSRGIGKETLVRNRIAFGKVWMPQLEDETTAIAYPYYRGTELINVKWRDGKKNFRFEAGSELCLYGLNDIGTELIWVEGEMDKLALEEAGYLNVVSVPNGAPPPTTKDYEAKFKFLEADAGVIGAVKRHILAVDGDAPGYRLQEELARRIGKEMCWRVRWPTDCNHASKKPCKDANDVLINHGPEVLVQCIQNADPYPMPGVITLSALKERIKDIYDNGISRGYKTGWDTLDPYYTIRLGDWTLVTGIPQSGKSTWLNDLMLNLIKMHGWTFAICSPENQPEEAHAAGLLEQWIDKPFYRDLERMTEDQMGIGLKELEDRIVFLHGEEEMTLDWILDQARACVLRYGIKGLILDPWNEIEHKRPANMTGEEYQGDALRKINRFAQKHDVHVWVVAHPNKMEPDKQGKYRVPSPYDVSGSAHWYNKPDVAITVHRDAGDPENAHITWIHITKVRRKGVGKVGKMRFWFNHPTGRYIEPTPAKEDPSQQMNLAPEPPPAATQQKIENT